MKIALYSEKFIKQLSYTRHFIAKNTRNTPLFDTSDLVLPRLIRVPSLEEITTIRDRLLEQAESDKELAAIAMQPSFYTTSQFMEFVFSPVVTGFTFKDIGTILKRLNLRMIGFEFAGMHTYQELEYLIEFPQDPHMLDCDSLHSFLSHPRHKEYFELGNTINFACEKV